MVANSNHPQRAGLPKAYIFYAPSYPYSMRDEFLLAPSSAKTAKDREFGRRFDEALEDRAMDRSL
ncbi:MAG: hypothetical protein DMG30_28750 [Acidobacteria bacterium]|nr:MAG: hypothetical protein DMG30_28750 [Acidobacteriota bacterium]